MADIAFEKDLSVTETGIGGLKVVDLAVHGDSRGWFKENWQRAKMTALGIPDLRVVQNNISYNDVSVNIIFTISTNAFSPIAPTRIRRIRQRGCAAFGA